MATKPGNPDRGWNDPPMFSYSIENNAQKSPRRNILNKRVGHNLTTPAEKSTGLPAAVGLSTNPTMPPPSLPLSSQPSIQPSVQPSVQPSSAEITETECDSSNQTETSNLQEDCLIKFREVLSKCQEFIKSKVADDINKKLNILSDMWKQSILSPEVQNKTYQLSQALSRSEYDKANDIHIAMMVDHVSEVSQWIVGVKRLIQEAKKILPLPPQESEEAHKDKNVKLTEG
ncbi:steroid receptor RNA activator 1-like isoform X2 [Saccoglossus kowalevskii]|uniref:Steroid receptor RNA activator 1-like n=1 Tax=Saccoglossus kowalevskii TaxID=10224 RepID=A0ABM0MFE7_SACKO|nr:PREDICTED: steroid receptor RNA activator 1-like [Saccoglossus kowalevskii]